MNDISNLSKDEIQNIVKQKIKNNTKFLDEINQYLHNKGIEIVKRYEIVTNILLCKHATTLTDDETIDWVNQKLSTVSIDKNEIFQIVFMFFGNRHFKKQLDQFYTPMTICNFINSLLIPGKKAIDPACGTGDLLNQYQGNITLVDKSASVLEMTRFIKRTGNATIEHKDSLKDLFSYEKQFDYCVMNPPFGTKTIETNPDILNKYELGKDKEKQEIGLLFVELGLRLLNKNGILFAIVPNGYLGNTKGDYINLRQIIIEKYTLIGIVKLPDNAFNRSGTGVATSILIIQNKKPRKKYNIFIGDVKDIGYILNKKNTPFKYKTCEDGYYKYDSSMNPVIDEDLSDIKDALFQFVEKKKIPNLLFTSVLSKSKYESFKKSELDEKLIFDIKRYLSVYKKTIKACIKNKCKTLLNYCDNDASFKFTKSASQYAYIDIKSVNTPLYSPNIYPSVTLPGRARYQIKKNDILISKLKGKISFTIITEDKENLVASNGFSAIRPKDEKSLVIIFANLFTEEFKIQHQSMVTGSIMETLSDDDIKNIYIKENIDYDKYNAILASITILNRELITLG